MIGYFVFFVAGDSVRKLNRNQINWHIVRSVFTSASDEKLPHWNLGLRKHQVMLVKIGNVLENLFLVLELKLKI